MPKKKKIKKKKEKKIEKEHLSYTYLSVLAETSPTMCVCGCVER